MVKKRSIVAFLSLFIYGLGAEAGAEQLRDIFRAVRASVVVVRTLPKEIASNTQDGFVRLPGMGSGVLVSSEGKVMTAAHVVQAADSIAVQFSDGKLIPDGNDLAKIQANLRKLKPGDKVLFKILREGQVIELSVPLIQR